MARPMPTKSARMDKLKKQKHFSATDYNIDPTPDRPK